MNDWYNFLPENDGGYTTDKNIKMYILVKKTAPMGLGVNAIGHVAIATYIRYKDDPIVKEWATEKHFRKVTCLVTDEEFEKAKTYDDHVIMTEDAWGDKEITIGFKPREEWPEFFRSLKLYK